MKKYICLIFIFIILIFGACSKMTCDFSKIHVYGVHLHSKRPFQMTEKKLKEGKYSIKLTIFKESDMQKIQTELNNLERIWIPKYADFEPKMIIEAICSDGTTKKVILSDSYTFYGRKVYLNSVEMVRFIESMYPPSFPYE